MMGILCVEPSRWILSAVALSALWCSADSGSSSSSSGRSPRISARAMTKWIASTQQVSTQAVGKGQGRSSDPAPWSRATELRAEEVVIEHYVGLQYDYDPDDDRVADQKIGYDLRFTKGDEELHVEVKGTRNAGNQVNVTYGEVRHARTYEGSVLAVVGGIEAVMVDGELSGQGGSLRFLGFWNAEADSLTPTRYVYRVPDQEG